MMVGERGSETSDPVNQIPLLNARLRLPTMWHDGKRVIFASVVRPGLEQLLSATDGRPRSIHKPQDSILIPLAMDGNAVDCRLVICCMRAGSIVGSRR